MPRIPTVLQNEFSYHVGARCLNREWFHLPLDDVWEIFGDLLYFVQGAFNLQIQVFILMSNHFHLIVRTPDCNLSDAMAFFLRETTREINRRTGRINQAFGNRYFKTILDSDHYFRIAYKYIYQNSIRAGLAERVEDYKYSSLRGILGFEPPKFPIIEDAILFSDMENTLKWLNSHVAKEDSDTVRQALRKPKFKLSKDVSSKRPHRLENDTL